MSVMEQAIQHGADRRHIAQHLAGAIERIDRTMTDRRLNEQG
jgi:hypothetical protein